MMAVTSQNRDSFRAEECIRLGLSKTASYLKQRVLNNSITS